MKSITCKEAVHFILKKEEGKLSLWDRFRLWRHLAICSLCKIFARQSAQINETVKHRSKDQHQLSQNDKESIIRNVLGNNTNQFD